MRLLLAWLALVWLAAPADALEVWLASTERCTTCDLYRRAAQARGYGRALHYDDGPGLTIPILSIDKGLLAADVLSQLPRGEGPNSPFWELTLTVLVMDAGRVLFAADISESADPAGLRRSRDVMFPPDVPDPDHPALRDDDPYTPFFVREWNLEYFVDVALGKRPRRAPTRPVDLASPTPAPLGPSNVVLWGSAATPFENSLYVPTRIREIRALLEGMDLGPVRFFTLFGHGPGVAGNDTSRIVDGRVEFLRADVAADYAADAPGLNAVLTGVRERPGSRTLLVQVGHSGPAGSPLWGHALTVLPGDLRPIRQSGGDLVMVSGACHSGLYAQVVQCGFFAAHPEVLAAGCQLSPEALRESDDYLRHFFGALSGQASAGRRDRRPPTLHDAHWYAAARLEDHQLPYTTVDAAVDAHFAAHPEDLPESLSVAEIRAGARSLGRAEAEAAAALTADLPPDFHIPLSGYVEANQAADAELAEAAELSSAERNRLTALPYKLVLALLGRRVAYAALGADDARYRAAASCERQSLQDFLGGGR
ncbi:MAG TPA: hypothetical protein VF322_18030 [Gammaproteobacteria bacterium]